MEWHYEYANDIFDISTDKMIEFNYTLVQWQHNTLICILNLHKNANKLTEKY